MPDENNSLALTALQQQFIECYVTNGDGNAKRAAIQAGYTPTAAAAMGHRLLKRDDILRAIHRRTAEAIGAFAPIALKSMTKLAVGAKSEFVRQNASADLLDRAGHRAPEKHQVAVAGVVTIDIGMNPE